MDEDQTTNNTEQNNIESTSNSVSTQIEILNQQKLQLLAEIAQLSTDKTQIRELQAAIAQITQDSLTEYHTRKQ